MCSLFGNLAILDDDHVIRITDCGQTMCDDKAGSAFHQTQKRFLNAGFRAGVYAGSGLIQNEDAQVCEDGAGQSVVLSPLLAAIHQASEVDGYGFVQVHEFVVHYTWRL